MNIQNIRKVQKLAKEVSKLTEFVLENNVYKYEGSDYEHLQISKETGELRRRSMDLTRALAEMRKSN